MERLTRPVDIASLAYFRIVLGALLIYEFGRYHLHGWIRSDWVEPGFRFTFYGLDWVRPWPGEGMWWAWAAMAILAGLVCIGLFYRVASVLLWLVFAHIFLVDQANYLNHFYLIALLTFLMMFLPAQRALSVAVRLRPEQARSTIPAWQLWLIRAQIGIPYFYGGLAKLNADWLRGEPMRTWLAERAHYAVLGPLFTREWMVWAFTWGGLLIDLLAVPLLLWKRTRPAMFVVCVLFHLLNKWLFQIGVFPWLMIAATLMFFPPDWPRRLFRLPAARGTPPAGLRLAPGVAVVVGVYLALQILVPFRHLLYPGKVSWTEEGHRFAWHMKLRQKDADIVFLVRGENGVTEMVDPADILTPRQVKRMAIRPDMILQFAHHLAERRLEEAGELPRVHARVEARLNGRPPRPLVDPAANLAGIRRSLMPAPWILPLEGARRERVR